MANTARAPKQWCLTKVETVNSFENWRQNLQYTLSTDVKFAPFMNGASWEKKTRASPLHGLQNDGEDVLEARRQTAEQKNTLLELMLGQVANYCSVISRNSIIKNSTSLDSIWQTIRMHFGFQSTGAHFVDFADIKLEPDERPEDLFQRLMAFIDDNLLTKDCNISHHGLAVEEDEEMSPSLENLVVLMWLGLIHKDLPRLVKQRYGTELRSRSLASIKPEISQALDSLLDEIRSSDDARVMRTAPTRQFSQHRPPRDTRKRPSYQMPSNTTRLQRPTKICPLCKQTNRTDQHHFLSECPHLPDSDRKFMTRARQVAAVDLEYEYEEDVVEESDQHEVDVIHSTTRRVQVKQSPFLQTFCGHHTVCVTLDSGAETNMIRQHVANGLGASITKSNQVAYQADGRSLLKVCGETRLTLSRDDKEFLLEALVIADLDVDVLAGVPFMDVNDVAVRPAKRQVILGDGTMYQYGSSNFTSNSPTVRRAQSRVLRAPPSHTTIWPGDFIELDIPSDIADDILALEPRADSKNSFQVWPNPEIIQSVGDKIRIANTTSEPKSLGRNEHFCQVSPVFSPNVDAPSSNSSDNIVCQNTVVKDISQPGIRTNYSDAIRLDPDHILSEDVRQKFQALHDQYDDVFRPSYSGYNGTCGPFKAVVNMGPVQPPQRKGRLPQYARGKLVELQQKFDELEALGVFKRPEEVDVNVEYLNPSFLVKKASGGSRLVTAFADVGRYSKPQPSLMPDVDSTLRTIACWKYIVVSDLTSAFYQIPLANESMKYCGVVTPFRGVRVYTRSAMGMPGSETALEELMCRILGDLLVEGVVAKLADDLYCGGDTPEELLHNWARVLQALHKCGMVLSAPKTAVAPRTASILGWNWSQGQLHASSHRIATLSSCSPPTSVKGMRSFIGAYKALARVIPNCADILDPLDNVTAGRSSNEKVEWTDNLHDAFTKAQRLLSSNKPISLPHPNDVLWIVTDGATKSHGVGATLYTTRNGKPHLAGFFSAKLRKHQVTWLPCEVEALGIAAAVKHYSPYIVQSHHKACVLTDSKPCVQAFEKLCRGEFSSSPRVATFLATASRYQTSIRHLSGSANMPSDFASRNAPECENPNCQVCSFISRAEDSVIRQVSVQDVESGVVRLPFTSRSAWLVTQSECADLRRTRAHLLQGTRPSKKATNIRDVKRYLNSATLARDGLLVVKREEPLALTRECIIVPRQVLEGLLTALHIKLDHPSCHQLKVVCRRYLYALDMDKTIELVTNSCHQCASLKKVPHTLVEQSTGDPPEVVGVAFAADVLKRERQLVLVVREYVTSYTAACTIDSERHTSIRDALIRLCIELRPMDGPFAVVRTDPAPGFVALVGDELLKRHRVCVEIGRRKNVNKNPVAEKAIQELEEELLRQEPRGGAASTLTLSIAVARLNSRIRSQGLSSWEMLTQRDQFTHSQLPVSDRQLIDEQHQQRLRNHQFSEKAKADHHKSSPSAAAEVGDLVYLHNDRSKLRARERYLFVVVEGNWCNIRKFVGSQLRSSSYRVKLSECYKVLGQQSSGPRPLQEYESDEEDESSTPTAPPPLPPRIPDVISDPQCFVGCDPAEPEYSQTENTQNCGPRCDGFAPQDDTASNEHHPITTVPRRSNRQKRAPKHLDDFLT